MELNTMSVHALSEHAEKQEQLIAELVIEKTELQQQLAAANAELERVRQLPVRWRNDYAEAVEAEGGTYPVHHHLGLRYAKELDVVMSNPDLAVLVECNQCHERLTMDEFKRRGADDCDEGYSIVRDALASPAAEPVWSGWAVQYPGKLPKIFGAREIAELNCSTDDGAALLYLVAQAQPAPATESVEVNQVPGGWKGKGRIKAGASIMHDRSFCNWPTCHAPDGSKVASDPRMVFDVEWRPKEGGAGYWNCVADGYGRNPYYAGSIFADGYDAVELVEELQPAPATEHQENDQ